MRCVLTIIALLLALSAQGQDSANQDPAEVSVFVFFESLPQAGVNVTDGSTPIGSTDERGALFFPLSAEGHELQFWFEDKQVLELPLSLVNGEVLQIIVNLSAEGDPRVAIESSNKMSEAAGQVAESEPTEVGDPGRLQGYVYDTEDQKPVSNARIFVSGTPVDVRTDDSGKFSVQLSPGTYSISVLQGDYATQTLDGLVVASNQDTPVDVEMVPAGLELPEFVVLEPFVEGSLASVLEEQRETVNVANVLGAEAISRAGDSDAAGALKRVTGLSLVDGQFIVVRGLSERYSTTLLNGANVPSPDPTRRVVPLSLFPADILASVVVQKSYSADMPADFGGGSINLRTVGIPSSTFFKVSSSAGYNSQTTGKTGLDYKGGDEDYLAQDDGTRDFPTPDFQIEDDTLNQLPITYTPFEDDKSPDGSLGMSAGWVHDIDEDWRVGVIGAAAYDHEFSLRDEVRTRYGAREDSDGNVILDLSEQFTHDISRRFIDISGYLASGIKYKDEHGLDLRYIWLKSAEDEIRIREGEDEEEDFIRLTNLEWEEKLFEALQVAGFHQFPQLRDLTFDWSYSDASTTRDVPDARFSRYNINEDGPDTFSLRRGGDGNSRTYSGLTDDGKHGALHTKLPFSFGPVHANVKAGISSVERERMSFIRRFELQCGRACRQIELGLPLEQIFIPENFDPNLVGGFELRESTLSTDTYESEQDIDGKFLELDATFWDSLRVYLGYRTEDFFQRTTTVNRFNSEAVSESLLETSDHLPAASITYDINANSQIRASYSESVTRPEFRETTQSIFTEPRLDITITGNPDLVPVALTNYDLRYEYYFDSVDNVSIGLFYKELDNPIEIINQGGAGEVVTFQNADAAEIEGLEFEFYKGLGWFDRFLDTPLFERFYVSGNISLIESSITIGPDQAGVVTNLNRELQGQSPYVVNVQFGYDDEDRGIKATLLFNRFGERISFVGIQTAPDILEQPFDQLDFVYSHDWTNNLSFKVKAGNILDDEVTFTQADQITRTYTKGRDFSLGFTYKF